MGESVNFSGGADWLQEDGVTVIDLYSRECINLLVDYISAHLEIWLR